MRAVRLFPFLVCGIVCLHCRFSKDEKNEIPGIQCFEKKSGSKYEQVGIFEFIFQVVLFINVYPKVKTLQ